MRNLIKAITICGFVAIAAPAFAQVSFNIRIGPPPPRREVIVAAPFPGAIWVPGYYVFDYAVNQYRWVPGVWQRPPQPGVIWVAPRYIRHGRRYGFMAGHWQAPGAVIHRSPERGRPEGRGRPEDRGRGNGGRPVRNGRAPMGQ
ncbi:MAG TPA: hypothetical protein VFH95_01400 [Candidatus Kapabacteria bacterium]|nr:hypothetical protein [Candidatus Kapabacteria bacterium]